MPLDNPFEAGAKKIEIRRLDEEVLDRYTQRSISISDDGVGFNDRQHLESAYDLGKSVGQNKGHIYNYGQGEKAGGMRVAQTIVKMADKSGTRKDPDGPEIRMLAMLSRPMQKAAHG